MNKIIIFNVGAGFSAYAEINNYKVIIDLGKRDSFSPINDFILPLFKEKNVPKNKEQKDRYEIDQLFISHPHDDHISAIKEFDEYIYPKLVTVPNDNEGNSEENKINWDLIINQTNDYVEYLRDRVLKKRTPPLVSCNSSLFHLYYIPPKICEEEMPTADYANNISLAVLINIYGHNVLFPGDLMQDGMKYIIDKNNFLWNDLVKGIDILIAPHHGLRSSFSTYLFERMKNGKTRCLNIVSEKPTTNDSNRIVDSRYSSSDYCEGNNNLGDFRNPVNQVKTSRGHVLIDFSLINPKFEIYNDDNIDKLFEAFL